MPETISRAQLQELIRHITQIVLQEFKNIDPASVSIQRMNAGGKDHMSTKDGMDDPKSDAEARNDMKHDVERGLKDNEFERKAAEKEYQRNVAKVQQYRQVDKPGIKRNRDELQKQLRQI